MKIAIDNISLIKKFLKGEDTLLANRDLRIEKALEEVQLLTTQGILLAKGRFTAKNPNVILRLRSDYWQVLHQLALEASFIPLNLANDQLTSAAFAKYDYHSVPAGYQIHCQEASAFWKTWWVNHRKQQMMDMLLFCHQRWYPVKQMLCDTGTIYVKTWRGEQTLALSDVVVWLDRNAQDYRQRPVRRKHHNRDRVSAERYPYHTDLAASNSQQAQLPKVPTELQQIIQADTNRLIVHTVLGRVIIKGQNLTCTLTRNIASVP